MFEYRAAPQKEYVVQHESDSSSLEDDSFVFENIIKKNEISNKCNRDCNRKCYDSISENDLKGLIKDTENLQYVPLRQYLLNLLLKQRQFHLEDESFRIGSTNICSKYFAYATKISKYITESVLIDYKNGVTSYNENLTRFRFSSEEAQFKAFALHFARQYGESSPTRNSVAMPSYLTKSKMFHNYAKQISGEAYSYSSFCRLLGKHFGPQRVEKQEVMITFPKESTHSKCDECLSLKQLKRNAKTKEQQEAASYLLDAHHKKIGIERQNVWALIEASKRFPMDNMFIGFDDMDQKKVSFPRQTVVRKSLGGMFIVRCHLTGVQVYSGLLPENTKNIFILNMDQFEQGSNKSVSILHKTLLDFKNDHGQLPHVLHIGADNCWRENKNRYVFGYLSSLVKYGVFREVTMNFLPVGHTHDSVDRMFGQIAVSLKGQNTNTYEELIAQLKKVPVKPEPVVKELVFVWDWREFITPQFEKPELERHSFFRLFKFSESGASSKMNYKLWSTDKEWVPKTGIKLLKAELNFDVRIGPAPFRVESLNLNKIVSDVLTKFIPVLPESERLLVTSQWLKFKERMEKLPKNEYKLLRLPDLIQNVEPLPVSVDIDKWKQKSNARPKEIIGKIIPQQEEQGDFRVEATPGMDACVYTREKEGRPWLIRVRKVNTNDNTFTGVWLKKTRGTKNHNYRLDLDNRKKDNLVTLRTETVLLFGFTEGVSEDGCIVSNHWMNKLMKLYDDHDQTFV